MQLMLFSPTRLGIGISLSRGWTERRPNGFCKLCEGFTPILAIHLRKFWFVTWFMQERMIMPCVPHGIFNVMYVVELLLHVLLDQSSLSCRAASMTDCLGTVSF